jgi:hypothetical protein
MIVHKKKVSPIFILLLSTLIIAFLFLLKNTPGFKGDIEQEFRIFLKQPVLLKSQQINDNKIIDYLNKIFNAVEAKIYNTTNFKNIKLDVKFEDLEVLRNNRIEALKNRKLIKPEKINIKITFEGNVYEARARLKGNLSGHWENDKQWSLRIKLKKNKTIMSMNEFSLTVHVERDFPHNFLAYEISQRYNLLSPRYETVAVNFNGSDWGLMLMEEQFSESFYAKNKIKEGPIFKMTNEQDFMLSVLLGGKIDNLVDVMKWQGKLETKIFNEKKIRKKSNFPNIQTNNTLISIFKNIQEVSILNESDFISKIIKFQNVEEFAKNLAIILFLGDTHSYRTDNARYYLDPYNLKIRPILTDYTHGILNINSLDKMPLFYKTMFIDENFQKIFFETIIDLKNNFHLIEKDTIKICKDYGKNCTNMFNLKNLKNNIETLSLNKDLFKKKEILLKENLSKKYNSTHQGEINNIKLYIRAFNSGEIFLYNLTSEILKINKIIFEDSESTTNQNKNSKSLTETILSSKYNQVSLKKIKFIDNNYKSLKIYYRDEKDKEYSINTLIENKNYKKDLFFNRKLFNHNFIKIKKNNYIISKGTHIVEKPIIVPVGKNLIIEAGVTLKMKEHTYIEIQDGYVQMNGKENKPIEILSINEKNNWSGIYVYSTDLNKKSILKFVTIKNSFQFNNNYIQLTGAINFINTNTLISDINIINSDAEDAINIVNSQIIIKNSNFENNKSDAIDMDYSTGKIINNTFKNIGGDAIDLSGSKVKIKNVYAEFVFDKVISAGEKSYVEIENLKALNSGIVIASKDSSNVLGNQIFAKNCNKFDFIVFQKKSYFKGANMSLNNTISCNKSLVQYGSVLSINKNLIKKKSFSPKQLYE